ncbi:fumarylacetoacetate hydrolase family protein [Jiella sp. MQZ9-1]|uniref:Fumarylacetoacetate hydrolase family protein n=1 Tax=Jiella flava TaxID=2816857 RepID=A0A939G178_9HYPH|nr:fumarylacetoacetate hydrolase family protein [Jiella flava]MBO0663164.1 fumarylacetoacetate hydrolase family protein [Jiella flava]MCD2471582.1 fumarylacetoacetate hydrolase family protein [Jiella flava]
MTTHAFQAFTTPSLPIRGRAETFPVRRIYCVGRNYADHAVEMGHDPDKEPPFFFQKNPDNLVTTGTFPYPPATNDVHHEIELVVALAKGGTDIPAASALNAVFGYAIGLDMTRRDLQGEAKKLGRPWATGKAFEHSAPISDIVPVATIGHPAAGAISLSINGETRQSGDLAQMIWKTAEVIAHLSGLFELAPGDLIMTGTPAGVGPVARGDRLVGAIEGLGTLAVTVV